MASYSPGFMLRQTSGDPVPVHEASGGRGEQDGRDDPPEEPLDRPPPGPRGEREVDRVDDHEKPRHAAGNPGRHRKHDARPRPGGVRPLLPDQLVDPDADEDQGEPVVERERRIPLPARVDEPDLHRQDPRGDPRKGAHPAVPPFHGAEEETRLAVDPPDAEDPQEDRDCRNRADEDRPSPSPRLPRVARLESGEKERRRRGERGRPREPQEEPPERGPAGRPPARVPEREKREEQEHRFRVDRDEKERGREEQQEEDRRPRVLLAEPRHPLPEEEAHRKKQAEVADQKPGVEAVHRERVVQNFRRGRIEREEGMVRRLAVRRRLAVSPLDDREVPPRIELRVEGRAKLERDLPASPVLDRQIRARDHPPDAERQGPRRDEEKETRRTEMPVEERNQSLEA